MKKYRVYGEIVELVTVIKETEKKVKYERENGAIVEMNRTNDISYHWDKKQAYQKALEYAERRIKNLERNLNFTKENAERLRKEVGEDLKPVEYCICETDCLGCYHKDRKCKELRGYNK